MPRDENIRAIERAVTQFTPDTLDEYVTLYHSDARLHFLPPGLPPGRDGARLFYQVFLTAFPDARIHLEDFVAEGEKVALRYAVEATHRGEFMGVPATNRHVRITGITVFRFAGGVCVERWNEADFLGLLRQLGALPAP